MSHYFNVDLSDLLTNNSNCSITQELDVLAAHLNELGLGANSAGAGSNSNSNAPYPIPVSRANGKAQLPVEPSSQQMANAAAVREAAREASREAARESAREAAREASREAAAARDAVAAAAAAAAAAQHSDSDNEEEPVARGVRNDGTLLASDPPKPLYKLFTFLLKHCSTVANFALPFSLFVFFFHRPNEQGVAAIKEGIFIYSIFCLFLFLFF